MLYGLEEHLFRTYPVFAVTIECLINYHPFLGFRIKRNMLQSVFISLKVLEVSDSILRNGIFQHQLFNKGNIPRLELVCSWCMATREVKGVMIVFQKQWLEMCQCVLLSEKSPYTYLIIY